MTEADELALSAYLPLLLILAVTEITVGAYWSLEGKHSKKIAAMNLLMNMSWTCTLFPLLLDQGIFRRSMEALYEGTPRETHPFSEAGLFWCSLILVILLMIVNTIDVHQGFKSAERPMPDD